MRRRPHGQLATSFRSAEKSMATKIDLRADVHQTGSAVALVSVHWDGGTRLRLGPLLNTHIDTFVDVKTKILLKKRPSKNLRAQALCAANPTLHVAWKCG